MSKKGESGRGKNPFRGRTPNLKATKKKRKYLTGEPRVAWGGLK